MIYLDPRLMARWKAYQDENPAWTLNELIRQLLAQHFDEADTVKASVLKQIQDRKAS